jgi:hypothetical protein
MHSLVAMHRDLQAMVVEQGDQLDVRSHDRQRGHATDRVAPR